MIATSACGPDAAISEATSPNAVATSTTQPQTSATSGSDQVTTTVAATTTAGPATTTTQARRPVESLTITSEDFVDGFCNVRLAGPIFDDVAVAVCGIKGELVSPGTRGIQAFDLANQGRRMWSISPGGDNQRISSWGVGQNVVAAIWQTDTAASGLSPGTTTYELRLFNKLDGTEVGRGFSNEIASPDIREEPEIKAVSVNDTVFVTWENTRLFLGGPATESRAFSSTGDEVWSAAGVDLGGANQHYALVSLGKGSDPGIMHLDSLRLVVPRAFDDSEQFDMCSPWVRGRGDGFSSYFVDSTSAARDDLDRRPYALAPRGAYFGPDEDTPSISYVALGPGDRSVIWETPADPNAFRDWRVEGGLMLVETWKAGIYTIDPFSGALSSYGGPIGVTGNIWTVFPDWTVTRGGEGIRIDSHDLEADCPLFQAPVDVSDSFPLVSSP